MQFAARLMTHRQGGSEKYNRQQLQDCTGWLDARDWALVALAIEGECKTIDDLDQWLADVRAI